MRKMTIIYSQLQLAKLSSSPKSWQVDIFHNLMKLMKQYSVEVQGLGPNSQLQL